MCSAKNTKFVQAVRRSQRITSGPPLEEEIHAKVADELRKTGVAFVHCPNEGQVRPQYGDKLKRLGVSKGVPDLVIVTPPPCGGKTGWGKPKSGHGRTAASRSGVSHRARLPEPVVSATRREGRL